MTDDLTARLWDIVNTDNRRLQAEVDRRKLEALEPQFEDQDDA